jgi:hypothetical protein
MASLSGFPIMMVVQSQSGWHLASCGRSDPMTCPSGRAVSMRSGLDSIRPQET